MAIGVNLPGEQEPVLLQKVMISEDKEDKIVIHGSLGDDATYSKDLDAFMNKLLETQGRPLKLWKFGPNANSSYNVRWNIRETTTDQDYRIVFDKIVRIEPLP